jgi:hypothetical protein
MLSQPLTEAKFLPFLTRASPRITAGEKGFEFSHWIRDRMGRHDQSLTGISYGRSSTLDVEADESERTPVSNGRSISLAGLNSARSGWTLYLDRNNGAALVAVLSRTAAQARSRSSAERCRKLRKKPFSPTKHPLQGWYRSGTTICSKWYRAQRKKHKELSQKDTSRWPQPFMFQYPALLENPASFHARCSHCC